MRLLWEDRAWEDYLYWQMQDKKTLKRINALIKDIARNAFDGAHDTITDFGYGADRLDFRGLGLTFVGDGPFTSAGQIRSFAGPVNGWVEIDLNGDGVVAPDVTRTDAEATAVELDHVDESATVDQEDRE